MALGGGIFLTQNKVLPGSYINFISKAKASATVSDRGYGAMALELDWGTEGSIFEVTSGDFQKNSIKLFGYDYASDKLKPLRDLFLSLTTLYCYRLNSGGTKASNVYATALYGGIRGNDITTAIEVNGSEFDVITLVDGTEADRQTVAKAEDLKDNDWVKFKATATLKAEAGVPLSGGTNATVTAGAHQKFLSLAESYSFNSLGYAGTDEAVKGLYVAYTKRMRDEIGAKFQCVVYNKAADYEGVVSVKNKCLDGATTASGSTTYPHEAALVYWVVGVIGGCPVNKSNLNKKYDGEYEIEAEYTQAELIGAIKAGEFAFHRVGNDIRVLSDINTLVTVSDTKGDYFKENQTIRVCDQIANDIAVLFNTRYLGVVPNDKTGRIALWGDIVKYAKTLEELRAIEDFKDEDVKVEQGDTKKAVVVEWPISIVNAMAQLYMTVIVS